MRARVLAVARRWNVLAMVVALMAALGLAMPSAAIADPASYSVIFSGGGSAGSNHDRYYEETLRMWNIMKDALGVPVGNIYVLFADGTDPAIDRSSNVNSDWSMITAAGGNIEAGTSANLQNILTTLGDTVGGEDCFYFWSFDHGYNGTYDDNPPTPATLDTGGINGWGSWVPDEQFQAWTTGLNDAKAAMYAFAQCFAGDMKQTPGTEGVDVGAGNIFTAWAADWYEPSWGRSWADAWADGLEAGLTTTHELGQYALANDIDGPNGSGAEHPGWAGANFDILTNEIVPEPASVLFFLGCVAAGAFRLRKRSQHLRERE